MEKCITFSKYRFIGIEDNKLSYKCIKLSYKSHISINGLDKKFPNIYKFAIMILKNSLYC